MSEVAIDQIFFDPFAPEGEQEFNGLASWQAITERYQSGDVEHDYSLDEYVAETEALVLDSVFLERFSEVEAIVAGLHDLCQHDGQLQQAVAANETLSALTEDAAVKNSSTDKPSFDSKESSKKKKKVKPPAWRWFGSAVKDEKKRRASLFHFGNRASSAK